MLSVFPRSEPALSPLQAAVVDAGLVVRYVADHVGYRAKTKPTSKASSSACYDLLRDSQRGRDLLRRVTFGGKLQYHSLELAEGCRVWPRSMFHKLIQ